MYGRKVKLRFLFVIIVLLILILSVFLVLKSLEENVVYFQSPSEIYTSSELDKKKDQSWRNGKKKLYFYNC